MTDDNKKDLIWEDGTLKAYELYQRAIHEKLTENDLLIISEWRKDKDLHSSETALRIWHNATDVHKQRVGLHSA